MSVYIGQTKGEKELTEIAIVQITNVASGPAELIDRIVKEGTVEKIAKNIKRLTGFDDVIVTEYKQFVRDK